MSDDATAADSDDQREPGFRKDGKQFKPGNTRDDGSYTNGKNRAPVSGQFRKGDDRPRGKRPKGGKNSATIWQDKLQQRRTIDGKTMSNHEWLVEGLIRRAIIKSDRAAEIALSKGERLETSNDRKLSMADDELLKIWSAQLHAQQCVQILDDADHPAQADGRGAEDLAGREVE